MPTNRIARQRLLDEYDNAARPLHDALVELGYPDDALSLFITTDIAYEEAIPVLLEWLPRIQDARVKGAIIRALTTPEAAGKQTASILLKEFRETPDDYVRWTVGNAFSVLADNSVFDDIVEIARDPTYGKAREMFAFALGNVSDPKVGAALAELLDDPQVAGHAAKAIQSLKANGAAAALDEFVASGGKAKLERLIDDERRWVRQEARRSLKALPK